MARSRRSSSAAASAAAALLLVATLAATTAPTPAAASARALLQAGGPGAPVAGGFGALFQSLPLKDMLAGGQKAFGAWRQGAKQLAQQRRDGADADVVGSDLPAAAAAVGARQPLVNTTVDKVPTEKQLFVYNTTGVVGGEALPAVPKDGTFTLLPAGCVLREKIAGNSGSGGESAGGGSGAKSGANLCSAVKLEANAGSNTLETLPASGVVSTDGLNATANSRDTVLTDFARLKLRYQELSLDDNIPGVPVPFDLSAVVSAGDGARINGTAHGTESVTLSSRVWGMWTNGEPAIPLRSGIFTLVSSNATMPFELMGANYTLRLLGLPVQGGDRAQVRGGDDRLFVPTPRDALLGAASLRKTMGSEWAKDMRVQSVYVPRGSPVKILLLPAAVELVQPSQAMQGAVARETARRAQEAAEAEIQAAKDAEAKVMKEVTDYREALLAAAANGTATVEDLLAVGAPKEGEEGNLKRMPLPWQDDAVEGYQESDAKRHEQKQLKKQQRAEQAVGETQPGQLFSQAAKAVELVAQGVTPAEAEKQAAEAAQREADEQRKQDEAEEAAAESADADAGEEVYEDDGDDQE